MGNPLPLHKKVREHEAFGQFVRFAMAGTLNFLTYFAIYNVMLRTKIHPVEAGAIAFAVASVLSFFLNKFWTFRDRDRSGMGRQYVIFLAVSLVGLGINAGALAIFLIPLKRFGTLGKNGAALCATPFSLVWNFTAYRRWTFRSAPAPTAPASSGGA